MSTKIKCSVPVQNDWTRWPRTIFFKCPLNINLWHQMRNREIWPKQSSKKNLLKLIEKNESYKFTIDIKIVVTKVINKLKKWPDQEHRRYQPSSFSSYRIRIDNYSQTKITVGGVTVSLSNMKKYSGVNKIDKIFSLKNLCFKQHNFYAMRWLGAQKVMTINRRHSTAKTNMNSSNLFCWVHSQFLLLIH